MKPTFDAGVKLGEITRQRIGPGVFYGLPHSSTATAYWEHGRSYRDAAGLPEYDEFVSRYVTSGMPNGLRALARVEDYLARNILTELATTSGLTRAVEGEVDFSAVVFCMGIFGVGAFSGQETAGAVAHRMDATCDEEDVNLCLRFFLSYGGDHGTDFCRQVATDLVKHRIDRGERVSIESLKSPLLLHFADRAAVQEYRNSERLRGFMAEVKKLGCDWVELVLDVDRHVDTSFGRKLREYMRTIGGASEANEAALRTWAWSTIEQIRAIDPVWADHLTKQAPVCRDATGLPALEDYVGRLEREREFLEVRTRQGIIVRTDEEDRKH